MLGHVFRLDEPLSAARYDETRLTGVHLRSSRLIKIAIDGAWQRLLAFGQIVFRLVLAVSTLSYAGL